MAGLVNAVAFTVNGIPVTLYDIDRFAQQQNISKVKASLELFKQAITQEIAEEKKVKISKLEVKAHIKAIQDRANLDDKSFKQSLQIQGLTYDEYYHQIYMQKLQQKLVGTITYGKVSKPTKKEKINFFNQNIKEFSLPASIDTTFFQSPNKMSLVQIKRSPMFTPADVKRVDQAIDPKKINPKIVEILLTTPIKSYTKIIQLGAKSYGMFFIKKIAASVTPDFKSVEKQVEKILMTKKRSTYINNFFQDKMRQANVKYIKIEPLEL
jgi:hypothetical protein